MSKEFTTTLQALPIAYYPGTIKPRLENSNKVILPQNILDSLIKKYNDDLQFPIIFKLQVNFLEFYVGVEEFTFNNNIIYIPNHVIQNNMIELNQKIVLTYSSPPKGNFVKLQPHQTKFTQITNFKNNLENNIVKYYPVLSKNSTISLYDEKTKKSYLVDIVECEPSHVIVTNDIDLTVDFAEPKDYQQVLEKQKKEQEKLWKIQRELEQKERETLLKKDKEKKEKIKKERIYKNNRRTAQKLGRAFIAFSGKSNRLGNS